MMRDLRGRVDELERQEPPREVALVHNTDDDETWRDSPAWAGGKLVDRAALEECQDVLVHVLHWTGKWRKRPRVGEAEGAVYDREKRREPAGVWHVSLWRDGVATVGHLASCLQGSG